MKKGILTIFKMLANSIYFFMKAFPTKNKIVMFSRQANTISLDYLKIEEEIRTQYKDNIQIVVICKKLEKTLSGMFSYCVILLKMMYHLATSKVCIIDGYCIPVSILKHKKSLKVIQIWHASGAIKKFGYQVIGTKEGTSPLLADAMCMHKNYDYVLSPSKEISKIYKEAFQVEEDKIKLLGLPRLEYLVEKKNQKKEILKKNPHLKNKKIILYVPTFRKGENVDLTEINKCKIDEEKYALIIRLHPLDTNIVEAKNKIKGQYSTYDLVKIADYIITDYSVLLIEASLLNKPIYLYTYDYEEYKKNRGLNIDLKKEMKSIVHSHFSTIIQSIEKEKYDLKEIKKIKNKYIEINPKTCTSDLVSFIICLLKGEQL